MDITGADLVSPKTNQRTGEISHHLLQESFPDDNKLNIRPPNSNLTPDDTPHWIVRSTSGPPKAREIMLPDQQSGVMSHPINIERGRDMPDAVTIKNRPGRSIENGIPVVFQSGGTPGMKPLGNQSRRGDTHLPPKDACYRMREAKKIRFF
jgi:hypothetical protein